MIRHLLLSACVCLPCACETKRVEYRRRPSWMSHFDAAATTDGTTSDGTEIRWVDGVERRLEGFEQTIGGQRVRIWDDAEDGTITVTCVLPMHVVVNTLECLRRKEYRVIWEQLISTDQRAHYDRMGPEGYEQFLEFFRDNRTELAAMLNRMHVGKVYGEVMADTGPDGGTLRLRPDVVRDFEYAEVRIVREGKNLKLADIR